MNTIYNEISNENTFNTATFKPRTVVTNHTIPSNTNPYIINNLVENQPIASSGTNNIPGF